MSLHIGRLPPHVRVEELERVFQRFGRCSVRMKDGYGFVIYDVAENAGRALRILRGKVICGERITLSWSNRQPRPFQRFPSDTRYNERYPRDFRDGNTRSHFGDSQGLRELAGSPTHARISNHRGPNIVTDRQADLACEDVDIDTFGDNADRNPNEVRRDVGNGNHDVENIGGFDRYQPDRVQERSNENENNHRVRSYSSEDRSSLEKGRGRRELSIADAMGHLGRSKSFTCYHCGKPGHIARNCRELDIGRRSFKFYHERDDMNFTNRLDKRQKRFRSDSWGREEVERDLPMLLHPPNRSRKELSYVNARGDARKDRSSSDAKVKRQHKHRSNVQEIKIKKWKHGTTKKVPKRRNSRRSRSPSLSSASSSTSQMNSRSLRSLSTTSSRSSPRSASSWSGTDPSRSRCRSRLPSSKSTSFKTKSKARSRSFSRSSRLSLSISLDSKSPSSPKNEKNLTSENPKDKSPVTEIQSPGQLNIPKPDVLHHSPVQEDAYASNQINGSLSEHIDYNSQYLVPSVDVNGSTSIEPLKGDRDTSSNNLARPGEMAKPLNFSSSNHPEGLGVDSTFISAQEMVLALRHYGLLASNEGESDISTERYFGAARLWPWEIIYFRRTKKGPISHENYMRRLKQNQEFGIVDKYIRSSTGWGQFTESD